MKNRKHLNRVLSLFLSALILFSGVTLLGR